MNLEYELVESVYRIIRIKDGVNRVIIAGFNEKYFPIITVHDYKTGRILFQTYSKRHPDLESSEYIEPDFPEIDFPEFDFG